MPTVATVLYMPGEERYAACCYASHLPCVRKNSGSNVSRCLNKGAVQFNIDTAYKTWGKFLHCVGTAWALRAYCVRRGWDTHPSNTVGGDRIISLESISEK